MTQRSNNLDNKIIQVQSEFELLIGEKPYLLNFIANSPTAQRVANDINAGVVNNTKYEWQEQKLKKRESLLASDSLSGSTSIEVSAGEGINFKAGSILKFINASTGAEIGFKSIVTNVVGDVLTVNRVIQGVDADLTTANNAKAIVMTDAEDEGLTYVGTAGESASRVFNYTQVMTKSVQMTKTSLLMNTYDKQNDLPWQVQYKMSQLLQELERGIIDNPKYESGDIRSFGGIKSFIGGANGVSKNVGGDLAKANIDELFDKILERGGMSDNMLLVGNSNQIARISALTDALTQKQQIDRSGQASAQNLGNFTASYTSPYFVGNRGYGASLVTSYAMNPTELLLIDANKIGIKYVSPMALIDTSSPNVRKEQRSLDVELTLCVENGDDSHGILTGLNQ